MPDLFYENAARQNGATFVCGIDEAGRGPLAGPVYAAAVILSDDCHMEGLDDSKKLSEKKREELFDVICQKAIAYGIASASEQEIDQINILNATFLAMCRAVEQMKVFCDYALVDGNRAPKGLMIPSQTIVKGDSKSLSIAAASVLAKVTRDRVMMEFDRIYPQYQFAKHKGYPTKLHMDLVREFGPSAIHRLSFLKKVLP